MGKTVLQLTSFSYYQNTHIIGKFRYCLLVYVIADNFVIVNRNFRNY